MGAVDGIHGRMRDSGPVVLTFALAAIALLLRLVSPALPETGDAVAHYQHARYFWQHAEAALSQWGKPVFSLLSSPFAPFGLWCMTLFNVLVASGTCLLIMHTVRDRCAPLRWAVPVLLFTAPVYLHTVISGLTEPLFGCGSIAVVVLLLAERWRWAMVLLSVLPFVRPEYAAFVPFALLPVLFRGRWKALPWLAVGPAAYSLLSAILLDRPWALFAEHTYLGVTTYGRGDPLFFVRTISDTLGPWLLVVLVPSAFGWLWLIRKDAPGRGRHITIATLTVAPATGILVLHSYAWWHGGMGSLGLDRVMATTVPFIVVFVVHVSAAAWQRWMRDSTRAIPLVYAALVVYGALASTALQRIRPMPYQDDPVQHALRDASTDLNRIRRTGQRMMYADPYLAALCDIDPWDLRHNGTLNGMRSLRAFNLQHGDLVVWDSHFAGYEGHLPLDSLLGSSELLLERVFEPPEPVISIGGLRYGIHVFRHADAERMVVQDTLFATGKAAAGIGIEGGSPLADGTIEMLLPMVEFPFTLTDLPVGRKGMQGERILVSGRLTQGTGINLVFVENGGGAQLRYQQMTLTPGAFEVEFLMEPRGPGVSNKLYVWNPELGLSGITDLAVVRKGIWQTIPENGR